MGKRFWVAVAACGLGVALTMPLQAKPAHHHAAHHAGVHFAHGASHGGYQNLVSDGPGTSFGFHRDPAPYRIGAARQRYRQANAVHQAVDDDALTSGGYYGFPGDSVYGEGNEGARGVFNGADGYGSPYFAGFYGPAGGTDNGVFGHSYDDE